MVQGETEAMNEAEVRVKLRAQQLTPLKIIEGGLKSGSSAGLFTVRVNSKELQIFTRQFATLIDSGIPVMQSLELLERGIKTPMFSKIVRAVRQDVSTGKRLGEAMQRFPQAFDRLYVNLVKAGEEGGVLDTVFNRLAVYIEKSSKLKGQVVGAMYYPAGVLVVALLVISLILTFVIPKFQEMFAGSGQELPALTQMVISWSEAFRAKWYLYIGGVCGGGFALLQWIRSEGGKKITDRIFIKLPIFGPLIQKSAIARFTRTMETLVSSGVGILDSLEIAASTVGNVVIEEAILRSKTSVELGKTVSEPLATEKMIPDMVVQMISVGEQTGNMDAMMGKIADFYEEEVDNQVGALTSLMEPIMMVFLGGIVATLVIAMYLPIFNLADSVG
jgi:type IV pilus assembly protein PilC